MGEVRWWRANWFWLIGAPLFVWGTLLVCLGRLAGLVGDVLAGTAGSGRWWVPALFLYCCFLLALGRLYVLRVGLSDDALLVRHTFPGRVETIPFSRIKRILVTDYSWAWYVVFLVDGALPVVVEQQKLFYTWSFTFPDWDGFVSELRRMFEPDGKLQVV